MRYAIYAFAAVVLVLFAGWTIYVLPTPGAKSAWELVGALVPALILLIGAISILWMGELIVRLIEYVHGKLGK